jgi:PIN domain nuclease of toxin-antitoxin system
VIVADTHALIWWVNDPERLSRAAREAFDASPAIGVPAICFWEIAMLAERHESRSTFT